jgi:protein-tyrosine-phosphatase
MEKYLKENEINEFIIDSSGIKADKWEHPYPFTLKKLEELGVEDINFITNQKITNEILDSNTLIICMTKSHQDYIKENLDKESYLFNELAIGKKIDLQDDNEVDVFASLEEFVVGTIVDINNKIPNLTKKIMEIKKEKCAE